MTKALQHQKQFNRKQFKDHSVNDYKVRYVPDPMCDKTNLLYTYYEKNTQRENKIFTVQEMIIKTQKSSDESWVSNGYPRKTQSLCQCFLEHTFKKQLTSKFLMVRKALEK